MVFVGEGEGLRGGIPQKAQLGHNFGRGELRGKLKSRAQSARELRAKAESRAQPEIDRGGVWGGGGLLSPPQYFFENWTWNRAIWCTFEQKSIFYCFCVWIVPKFEIVCKGHNFGKGELRGSPNRGAPSAQELRAKPESRTQPEIDRGRSLRRGLCEQTWESTRGSRLRVESDSPPPTVSPLQLHFIHSILVNVCIILFLSIIINDMYISTIKLIKKRFPRAQSV